MPTNSRTEIIVLDAATIGPDHPSVARFKTSPSVFHGWRSQLPCAFLVSTNLDADTMSEFRQPCTKNARSLVSEVNPTR